jgi:hypothetical protein
MKTLTLTLTNKEAKILKTDLFDLQECLRQSCECKIGAPICDSCQELPFVQSIIEKLNATTQETP